MGNRISKILFQKAEDDLGIAKLAITNQSYLEMANFHLQQAAEKLLKSYLASKEIEFPRTHDLDAIYNLCLPTNIEFKKFENLGELFNEFAVLVRLVGEFLTSPPDPLSKIGDFREGETANGRICCKR